MSEDSFEQFIKHFREENAEIENCQEDSFPCFEISEKLEMKTEEKKQVLEENEDSSQELDDFIKSEKSKNTVKKTILDWKKFENFCQEKTSNTFDIKTIPAADLDKLLAKFFKDVRKKDGEEYEPDTLSSFQKSVQRHIGELKLSINILRDDPFTRSREVLASKRKNLVKQGRGNKPNACRELTEEDVNKLFGAKVFGSDDPVALQRTLWWFISMHFGFRARDESRKLCWGDVVLDVDPATSREVLVWTAERGSKTRQGFEGGHRRQFNPKVFATGTDRCPVLYYKLFRGHRPEKANSPSSPFFLAVNHKNWRKRPVWYKCSPLGKNEIGKFLTKAAEIGGLGNRSAKIANHSVRKTGISRLLDAGVPENFVMQLSGHKNIQSLSSYKSASIEHQRLMSDTLSRAPSTMARALENTCSSTLVRQEHPVTSQTPILSDPRPNSHIQGQTLFAGATIGSISHCVFNVIQPNESPDPASFQVQSSPKRQRIV